MKYMVGSQQPLMVVFEKQPIKFQTRDAAQAIYEEYRVAPPQWT